MTPRCRPGLPRTGFTIMELVFVIVVGAILQGMAIQAFGQARSKMAASGARATFVMYHSRARSAAIETGAQSGLAIDAISDSLAVVRSGVVVDAIDLWEEFGVNVITDSADLFMCMGPRGLALPSCNTFTAAQTIFFVSGVDTSQVELLPLGQLIY